MEASTLEAVHTTGGRVEGVLREGHLVFWGIPYAAPPVGDRRFRPPQPASPWSTLRLAREIGYAAPQTPHPIQGFAASGPQDEDCLNLNVFTPAADGAGRPVLLWIHGGGFTHGAGYEAIYDGGAFASRHDVVVVSINYRLGALGFLSLPEAGFGPNLGLLDQIAALKWVQANIESFGGDPANVTIFGESAGSASVAALLAMPAARGLFNRAILQSGVGRAAPPEIAARTAAAFLEALGLPPDRAAELQQVPVAEILRAQVAVQKQGLLFGPVRDPGTLPDEPLRVIRQGAASETAVLIGSNRDEVKLFAAAAPRQPLDEAGLLAAVRAALPEASEEQAKALVETYRASRRAKGLPTESLDILDAVQSDVRFRIPSIWLASAQRAVQPNTYLYLFTHASPARRGLLGACHALEMPFVFGTHRAPGQDRFCGAGPEVERLSAEMNAAWAAFARTGDPSTPTLAWPAFDPERRTTMVFDTQASRVESDPFGEERAAIEPLM
ncbi:MAG: carboxylesterase/lipase family protein [Phenylobacterium sp.]|jgi:para-nitrobenzyl esterase|uniref:carboxylesterase/lipase family protein n=1 Tax=Phenylobacterium sp. TaxID=1871053 RepID=UPI002A36AE5C|nr:carboxylesterase/lipase family protein [Phenylobacterium sp.]MDX9997744.1 carboxylesterase/lipase family protein [Phenylobacterium sp.]